MSATLVHVKEGFVSTAQVLGLSMFVGSTLWFRPSISAIDLFGKIAGIVLLAAGVFFTDYSSFEVCYVTCTYGHLLSVRRMYCVGYLA